MSPRTPHVLLCFLVSLGIGRAAEIDWSDHGLINLDTPPGWKLERQDPEGAGCSFSVRPESGVVALLQITVVDIPEDQTVDSGALRDRLHESVKPFIEQSVEREFRPVALSSRPGWYVELTDAQLAGKPAVPGDYKVMRSALVLLNPRTLVIATMLLDDPATAEAADMLAMVSHLRLDHGITGGTRKK
jgi:hypothetical protein